jgi:hypothetical protein
MDGTHRRGIKGAIEAGDGVLAKDAQMLMFSQQEQGIEVCFRIRLHYC